LDKQQQSVSIPVIKRHINKCSIYSFDTINAIGRNVVEVNCC